MQGQSDHPHLFLDAEVRLATFLKCDIVGSTRIATQNRLDLDGQRSLKRAYQHSIRDMTARYGGHIVAFEGDGALVAFGLPEPREDAPRCAVHMGCHLVTAIRSLHAVPGIALDIRVGIASGAVAVELGDPAAPDQEPAVGLAINRAERMCRTAAPGTVVADAESKRLTARFFEYEDLGAVEAKGFDAGVHAWRVLGAREEVATPHETAIVGREREREQMWAAWQRSLQGIGHNVYLIGDPGIGKTRLARDLLERAREPVPEVAGATEAGFPQGATTLQIDCAPSTSNSPLFPVGVALRRYARIDSAASEDEARAHAQALLGELLKSGEEGEAALLELGPLFGLSPEPTAADHPRPEAQERTIATIVKILATMASERPLVLLCEDAHWADATTLKVVQRLAQRDPHWRGLLIVTTRDAGVLNPELPNLVRIDLAPLDEASAAELVDSLVDRYGAATDENATALTSAEKQSILELCSGVPLFLEEVTREKLEASDDSDSEKLEAMRESTVPAALRLVVQSRLHRLHQVHRAALIAQTASVLGREFSAKVLTHMVPANEGEIDQAIAKLAEQGLFSSSTPDPLDRVKFKHALIRDAVYATLLSGDRKRLHSRAADVLRTAFARTPDASADIVALHLCEAGRFFDAIDVRLAASYDTALRGAYAESAGHCVAGLWLVDRLSSGGLLPPLDALCCRKLRLSLLVRHAVALTGSKGYAAAEVEDLYGQAQALFDADTTAEERYPVIRGLATLHLVRGNLSKAKSLSRLGMRLAEESGRADYRIDSMSVHSYTTFYYGRLQDCRDWIEKCRQLYDQATGESFTYPVPQDAKTAVLALLPTVAWLLGDARGAEEAIHGGRKHVEALGRDFDKALLHAWIAGTRYTQRRYREALEQAQKAVEISQPRGYEEWHGTGALLAYLAQAALTASPAAIQGALTVCERFKQRQVGLNASYYLCGLARALKTAGDEQGALGMLYAAHQLSKKSRETRMHPELLLLQAELTPQTDAANALRAKALKRASKHGAITTSLRVALAMIERGGSHPAEIDAARATLLLLEGDCPPDSDRPSWIADLYRGALQTATRLGLYPSGS